MSTTLQVAGYFFRVRALSLMALSIAAVLLVYAVSLPTEVEPLILALQNHLLIILHIGFAVLAHDAAAASFGAAALHLLYPSLSKTDQAHALARAKGRYWLQGRD